LVVEEPKYISKQEEEESLGKTKFNQYRQLTPTNVTSSKYYETLKSKFE
jgi:hypothetical protein